MKWTKFILETTTEAVDLISDMLSDLGIDGIEICDNVPITEEERQQLFIGFLPKLDPDDGTAKVSFYLESDKDSETVLESVKEGLKELSEFINVGNGEITISETEDKDWINNWKQFFKPFRIDDTIVIKPTWEVLMEQKATDLVIEIDPGTSFGTGSHETTKLAIIGLKKYLKPDSVILDAGSGSGILSIIAKKLGARKVLGIDIDPIATGAAFENARVNHLSVTELNDRMDGNRLSDNQEDFFEEKDLCFLTGNIIEDDGIRSHIGKNRYDIVVANILADVIIKLSAVIGENLKHGGYFISSGIINTKEEAVREALILNNFEILEVIRMGDWVSFICN